MGHGIVAETAGRIFEDLADPQAVLREPVDGWKGPLWSALEANGLTLAWVPEALGGANVGLAEGFEVAEVAGRAALGAPLLETMFAGWLLGASGIAPPDGVLTVAPASPRDCVRLEAGGVLRGAVRAVPFARDASHAAVFAEGPEGPIVALVATGSCALTPGLNLAGEPRDTLQLDGVRPTAVAPAPSEITSEHLLLMGSVIRALQIAGALQAILDRTVAYANERIAFGKPIGRFQAVQVNIARLAGEVAAASAAARSAADAFARPDETPENLFLEAAAAKIRAAEAAAAGVAVAHQAHGAIGLTTEHVLHRFTLRALAWREDFGDEVYWATQLGRRSAALGDDGLWPLLASR